MPSGLRPVGVALAAFYLIALVATLAGHHHPPRPLYEGFSPPPPYRWVTPPPAFASGNQKPKSSQTLVSLALAGSVQQGPSSDDAQFILNLAAGAVPPHNSDTDVRVTIDPVDPATLGPTPTGLNPDGNAYRVQMTYRPSNSDITDLAKPGDVIVQVPTSGQSILYSPDGKTWTPLKTQDPSGATSLGAAFSRPGYYLGSTITPVAQIRPPKGSKVGTYIDIAMISACLLGIAIIATLKIVRRSKTMTG